MKAHPNDRMKCSYCGGLYTRSHRSEHRKTKVCKAYQKANAAIKQAVLNISTKKVMSDSIRKQYEDDNGKITYLTEHQYKLYSKMPNIKYKLI
jgi:predicted  nucleic acid-binding Zn-ribbon protein